MNKPTPWQQWATDYQSKVPTFLQGDPEYVDAYSHAAWEECKKRCLEILERHKEAVCVDHFDDHYYSLNVRKEIEKL